MLKVKSADVVKSTVLALLCSACLQLQAQTPQASACLDQALEIPYTAPDAGDKAKSAGKGILGSILSGATGGAVSTKGGDKPDLARRPKYDKSRVNVANSDLKLEFQGALDEGKLRMAVRVRKDRDEGGPHLIALQDINCRMLMPETVEVFELWDKGGLSVSWSSSTYQDGSLVGKDSGAFDTDWATLQQQYPGTSEIPGIWQSYQQPPFDGIRGVTAVFQPPPGEIFAAEDWFLVTHITRPSSDDDSISTQPVVTRLETAKDDEYAFTQAQNIQWQPGPVATSVSALQTTTGLVCTDDCKEILKKINEIECAREDCADEQAAVEAAETVLANAQQVLQDAEADLADAKTNIQAATSALDKARADRDRAKRKLDIESVKQDRLIRSLQRGGHGASAEQVARAVDFAKSVIERLGEAATDAEVRLEQAQKALADAQDIQSSAESALSGARNGVLGAEQNLALAKQALSDCLQRDWERCRAIEELWAEYHACRSRCREQDRAREEIDRAGWFVKDGREEIVHEESDYDQAREALAEAEEGLRELGGETPSNAREWAREAADERRKAEQLAQDAGDQLAEAEKDYRQGDLEAATEKAREARNAIEEAESEIENASDAMEAAAASARREYERLLYEQWLREQVEMVAAREAAALKKQACMRHIGEYFAQQGGDTTLLEELGAFVEEDAKGALDEARNSRLTPKKYKEFLAKVEAHRYRLEQILTLINGIGDNASIESRHEAFSTALDLAGELSERIPGLGEFFNFYSGAYNAAVGALFELQEEMIGRYKPMADDFIGTGNCCSYSHEKLENVGMEDIVNERWDRFSRDNAAALARLSGDSLRKLEAYFKSRMTVKWATCCLDYLLDG